MIIFIKFVFFAVILLLAVYLAIYIQKNFKKYILTHLI